MKRREFLQAMGGSAAVLFIPLPQVEQILKQGVQINLKCLGNTPGPTYLDGRTANSTVGLAPKTAKPYSGTKWLVASMQGDLLRLQCKGSVPGNRWLDGRTGNGSVGLAPNTKEPFTGTLWRVVYLDRNNPNIIALECQGKVNGPRWLDGRTANGSVGLAPKTDPPYTGTHWEVMKAGVIIDEG